MATTGSNPPIGRTETTEHTESVTAHDVIEGDRIAADLVVDEPEQLAEIVQEADPKLPLVTATRLDEDDPIHSALLVDPEAQLILRASRRNPAMASADESTEWTVHDVGSEIEIVDAEQRAVVEADEPVTPVGAATSESETLLNHESSGRFEYDDELELDGTTLSLQGPEEKRVVAEIRLSGRHRGEA
jgi:hypothetical protein